MEVFLPLALIHANNITPSGHRTPEQIQEQIEARRIEIAEIKASPRKQFPCKTCKWQKFTIWDYCSHPLITGVNGTPVSRIDDLEGLRTTSLCGLEKALWEPKQPNTTLWQRFINSFLNLWRKGE